MSNFLFTTHFPVSLTYTYVYTMWWRPSLACPQHQCQPHPSNRYISSHGRPSRSHIDLDTETAYLRNRSPFSDVLHCRIVVPVAGKQVQGRRSDRKIAMRVKKLEKAKWTENVRTCGSELELVRPGPSKWPPRS